MMSLPRNAAASSMSTLVGAAVLCLGSMCIALPAHGESAPPPPPSVNTTDSGGERSVFLSPFVRTPWTTSMQGSVGMEFVPELLDAIPRSGTFDLVQFPFPDGSLRDLWLTEFSVIPEDAEFVVMEVNERGETVPNYNYAPNIRSFRGHVTGVEGSLVFLAFSTEMISGFIQMNGSVFVISNGPDGDMPLLIADVNNLPEGAINWAQHTCKTPAHQEAGEGGEGGIAALTTCKTLRMAFETDTEYRGRFNTSQNALDYLSQIAAGMNTIYYNEENLFPVLVFSRIYAPSATDPWSADGDSGAALTEFQAGYVTSLPANSPALTCGVKHFISAKNLGGGVAATIGGTCGTPVSARKDYCVSGNLGGSFPYPLQNNSTQNWDIVVTTHETGHLLGCWHTHQTPPPGSNYDECGNGGCSGASSVGTIMSYCHICPGGLANIALRFAPVNKTQMDAYLGGAGGGCSGFSTPCPIYDPSNFAASDGTFADACMLTWRAPAVAAARFEIERGIAGSNVFTSLNANVAATATFYRDASAVLGVQYSYRIRAIKVSTGLPSDWVGPDNGYRADVGPINLAATDGEYSNKIGLTWDAPPTSSYTPSCYRIYRGTTSATLVWIDESTTTTYDDTGTYVNGDPEQSPTAPVPGVQYIYQVRALTALGCGTDNPNAVLSTPVEDVGFVGQPGPSAVDASGATPAELSANPQKTPALTDRIRLTWSLPGSVNRVFVYRSVNGGDYVEVASLNGTVTTWSDLQVVANIPYSYRLKSFQNLLGMSAPSDPDVGFRLDAPPVTSATDGVGSTVVVRWAAPSTWSPSSYNLFRKRFGRDPWPTTPLASDLSASTLTYTDSTVVPGEVYIYAVTAESALFEGASSQRGRTDNGYPTVLPPTDVQATDGAYPGFVYIGWTPNGATTNVSWQVWRRVAQTTQPYTLIRTTTQPFHFDSTAVVGTRYQYYVKTVAANGVASAPSATDNGFR